MKTYNSIAIARRRACFENGSAKAFFFFAPLFCLPFLSQAQAVSSIITDYNGYWKSTAAAPNTVKPDNNHNLLAFTYNGQQYSTGVNDALLTSNGETFIQGDFWSLPVKSISGTITSNTKVGLGALRDGVYNGPSSPPPAYGITEYLTDGVKGLNLGTCIANLPSGSMTLNIASIKPESIGDGVPDILVTQIADPSGSYDRYTFTDSIGVQIGNYKDIVFTNITPVGTWTADFYEANSNPLVLTSGFTQTDRPIRLWAADLSDLGITQANYKQVRLFKITLSGNSDVAFVGYNNKSFTFQSTLPVQYSFFKGTVADKTIVLNWQTVSEQLVNEYSIERSADGFSFTSIGGVKAKNGVTKANDYTYTDPSPLQGKNYYRLKEVDASGQSTISSIMLVDMTTETTLAITIYPNPAKGVLYIQYPIAAGNEMIAVYNSAGRKVKQQTVDVNSRQTKIELQSLPTGSHFIEYKTAAARAVKTFLIE